MGCSKNAKLNRLYAMGTARLTNDFNIVRMIKKLRHLGIIAESSTLLKSKERKFQVAHTYQNLIDLDSTGSEGNTRRASWRQARHYEGGEMDSQMLAESAVSHRDPSIRGRTVP